MKYLKIYEKFIMPKLAYGFDEPFSEYGKFYFTVHNDKMYLKKQMEKIGCPERIVEYCLGRSTFYDGAIIFLGVENTERGTQYHLQDFGSYFIDSGHIYKGPIVLTPEEIEQVEIEKNINKYNL